MFWSVFTTIIDNNKINNKIDNNKIDNKIDNNKIDNKKN